MDMTRAANFHITIDIPREKAWEILRDLSRAHHYVPGLVKTEITTDNKEGIGASRIVYQSERKGLHETVTEWNEGCGFLIRLHRGEKGPPPPFKEGWFRYAIEDEGDKTRLSISLIYTLRMGWFGILLERLLLGKNFHRILRDIAISMKAYYETGEPVTPARLKQLRAGYKA
jgi:hypothetical protein